MRTPHAHDRPLLDETNSPRIRRVSLGHVAQYINGRAFKPEDWKTEGLPIIRIQNLNDPRAPFNYFSGPVESRYLVNDGDLLISWSASLDAFIWNRGPAILNQHIFKAVEDSSLVTREYLYFAVRAAMAEIRAHVHGATMQHITRPEFLRIKIPLPALPQQREIASSLAEQMKLAKIANEHATAQIEAANALPAAYLSQVFESPRPNHGR